MRAPLLLLPLLVVVLLLQATKGEDDDDVLRWTPTGALAFAREFHTATLLADGTVLAAGGAFNETAVLTASEYFDPASATWRPTNGAMAVGRSFHTATPIAGGTQVLVAGGKDALDNTLGSVEIYQVATGTWSTGPDMGPGPVVRSSHTATLLVSGDVLVAGGCGATDVLITTEVYVVAQNVWNTTGDLVGERAYHTATLMPSDGGTVLVAGGLGPTLTFLCTAEMFDPDTKQWNSVDLLHYARSYHTSTYLDSAGSVLVAGGCGNEGGLTSVEIFDPSKGVWSLAANMTFARHFHTAATLPNGNALVIGGKTTEFLNSTEMYNVSSNTWIRMSDIGVGRVGHTATALNDGNILVAGGYDSSYLDDSVLSVGADCISADCGAGVCIDGFEPTNYTCNCSGVDYTGPHCETKIDNCTPNPCQHGGICIDGDRSYTCNCSTHWNSTNCETAVDCGDNGGLLGETGCACYSNFYPIDDNLFNCDGEGVCGSFPTVAPMATEHIGALEVYEIYEGRLNLTISNPQRFNRLVQSINLNGHCSYPGQFWQKTVNSSCIDLFNAAINMSDFSGCFSSDLEVEDPNFYHYSSSLTMKVIDDVGTIRGTPITRTTVSSICLEILLVKTVNVTLSNIVVSSELDVQVAVTRQILDVESRSLLLQLTTGVQDPYVLVNGTLDGASLANSSAVGCASEGDACFQTWNSTISLSEGCDFSGTYNISFQGACRDTGFECPMPSDELSVTFQAEIVEANLCENSISIVSGATGSLASYGDSLYSVPKTVFLDGETIFLEVTATADLPLCLISLSEVSVVGPSGSVVLYDGDDTMVGVTASFESSDAATYARFSFQLVAGKMGSGALFIVEDTEMIFSFDVEASVTLQYQSQFRKRNVESVQMTFTETLTGITAAIGDAFKKPTAAATIETVAPFSPPRSEERHAEDEEIRRPARVSSGSSSTGDAPSSLSSPAVLLSLCLAGAAAAFVSLHHTP